MIAKNLAIKIFFSLALIFLTLSAKAGVPVWTFTPLTETTVSVPSNDSAIVQYQVTNQSTRTHSLTMRPIRGIEQLTTGLEVCGNPFVLVGKASCVLSLQINGSQLTQSIADGPIVCQQPAMLECYRPGANDILRIKQAPPITDATITVTDTPLTLITNGLTGTLTINNTSLIVAATNITSNFTGTALDGNVTETANTCSNLPPQSSCTLTYTPGNTVVPQTDFSIKGSNTNILTAAIQIDSSITLSNIFPASGSASGGTGVILTGKGLTGTTAITFDGVAASNVKVINSRIVTAVTPAHAVGSVDVVITTPSGSATLVNGYTYLATAIGQPAFGGKIACLNGGMNDLIAASADNSTVRWGRGNLVTLATSVNDGATNTSAIVNTAGETTPNAATICNDYEIDSQGNTPCKTGNACYNDWFLPAGLNATITGQLNCLYVNQVAIGGFPPPGTTPVPLYWSSTQSNVDAANDAFVQLFSNGDQITQFKSNPNHVRCVRAFTP